MDVIVKEGPIFMQSVKFGKKIWRMTWLIVFEPSPTGIGRMELYDMRDGRGLLGSITARPDGLKKLDKRVIRLSDCLSITPAPGESCPTDFSAFFLNTITCTYTIAAPTREDWMSVLCKLAFQKASGDEDSRKLQTDKFTHLADNELYSTWGVGQFQVTAQSTDASKRCRISGPYLFSVEKDSIALLDLKTGKNIFHWPYRLLRKFGQIKGGIVFEAGRRCHTGEGHFIFLSNQGSQIHKAIEEAVMHQRVQDMLAEATSLPQEFASQPLSSDSQTQNRSKGENPLPIKMTRDRPRLPVQRKQGQQIHKTTEEVLVHHSAPGLLAPSTPLQKEEPPTPKPRTQDRPKDRPKVNNPPPVSLTHRQPTNREAARSSPSPPIPTPTTRVIVPRKNITLPDLPSIRIRPSIPDDVLYASLSLEPKPRSRLNLPRVPTSPSLVHINEYTDVSMDQEKNSLQEPSENEDEDNPYINWMAKTTAEQDKSTAEVVYSTINTAAKRENNQSEEGGDQEQPNIDQQISTGIPADFKQTLSNILFKDLSKISPSLPRSQGGSSDHLERTDRQTDD